MRSTLGSRRTVRNLANLVHCRFINDDDLARIRRIAVIALAGHAFAADAAQLKIERHIGMVLAHPSYAEADWAVMIHRL